jgi:hypothetical protein
MIIESVHNREALIPTILFLKNSNLKIKSKDRKHFINCKLMGKEVMG